MVKRLLAAGALAVFLTFGVSGVASADAPVDDSSTELAATGSVLGELELIVGVTGVVLLAGSGLLVVASHRSAHRGARR